MPDTDDKQAGPRSVLRVMNVLAMLAESTEGRTLAALSDQLDLPNGCPIVYSPQQRSFRAIGPGFSAHTLGVLEALAADRPIA